MLSTVKSLKGYQLDCLDGEIGNVKEFYFDDRHWTIRYLVANTGTWLIGRQVLISPYALLAINKVERNIAINLTKDRIKDSPALDTDKPVSRQFEQDYYGYYGWPTYWDGPSSWGSHPCLEPDRAKWAQTNPGGKPWDHHLRSTHAVTGYVIQAQNGELGQVEDFIMDDETWAIRYLIINIGTWLSGKRVLISPQWIEQVSWSESKVLVNLPRQTIKGSPEFTGESLITRDYEIGLHAHYNRPGYWGEELVKS
jgi:uncharacterized protein YrrD